MLAAPETCFLPESARTKLFMSDTDWQSHHVYYPRAVALARMPLGLPAGACASSQLCGGWTYIEIYWCMQKCFWTMVCIKRINMLWWWSDAWHGRATYYVVVLSCCMGHQWPRLLCAFVFGRASSKKSSWQRLRGAHSQAPSDSRVVWFQQSSQVFTWMDRWLLWSTGTIGCFSVSRLKDDMLPSLRRASNMSNTL